MNILFIRPQMRPELSQQHRLYLTRPLLHRLLLARRPSGCCRTEEPHRRTPPTAHQRTYRHVAEVDCLKCSFGTFWRCTAHQHLLLSPQLRHQRRTGLLCDLFISLTGISCFLLGWKLSSASFGPVRGQQTSKTASNNLSPAGDSKEESE